MGAISMKNPHKMFSFDSILFGVYEHSASLGVVVAAASVLKYMCVWVYTISIRTYDLHTFDV